MWTRQFSCAVRASFNKCSFQANLITKHQYDKPFIHDIQRIYNKLNKVLLLLLRIAGLLWCSIKKASSIASQFLKACYQKKHSSTMSVGRSSLYSNRKKTCLYIAKTYIHIHFFCKKRPYLKLWRFRCFCALRPELTLFTAELELSILWTLFLPSLLHIVLPNAECVPVHAL